MELVVKDIISKELALFHSDGKLLLERLENTSRTSPLTVNFTGLKNVSTAFLNNSIGLFFKNNSLSKDAIQFIFPEDSIFDLKVEDVIENALMAEQYDSFITEAC